MQEKKQKQQKQVIIVATRTIVHPDIDVVAVKYVHDIHTSVCNIKQSKQSLQRHPTCLTESDHGSILE